MRAVSLFAGAGGLDLGCEAAGFQTIAAVESDDVAQTTMLRNAPTFFPKLTADVVFGDVATLGPQELLDSARLARGEIDLVHGGPPCTPFSKSGYWLEYKRAGSDPKASLLDEFVRLIDGLRPKAFLMENVYGLVYRNHNRAVFQRFCARAHNAGYAIDHKILLAADFGVPQLRQRLFCVGMRRDLLKTREQSWNLRWPSPSHGGPHETRRGWDETLSPHVTAGQALAGLPQGVNPPEPEEAIDGTHAEALRGVPPGENYLFWTAERNHPYPRFRWRSRYWSFLLKLHPNKPAPTIQGQPGPWVGPFHWENRRLRVAEVKRLMAFPDGFELVGSRREVQLQLGNAVPPPLARVVAAAMSRELQRLGVTVESEISAVAA
jgi:DNA (cytosine-5)-methyltransferase 1